MTSTIINDHKPMTIDIEANPLKGILLCLLAYFFISLIGISQKAISGDVSIATIIFFQSSTCLILLIPELLKNNTLTLLPTVFWPYVIRIISGLGCYATLFYIIRYIPIAQALLYQYSGSLWIPLIMLVWFNVEINRKIWYGIIVGFIGILLILKPSSALFGIVSLIGILCSIFQAFSMVAIRKLSLSEPISRILFYYFLVGTTVSAPWAFHNWHAIDLWDSLLLLSVGITTYLAQKFLAISLKYAHASTLAPICYTSILFSGLLGWLFWQEVPEMLTIFGMLLVVGGCLLTIVVSRQPAKPEADLAYENS